MDGLLIRDSPADVEPLLSVSSSRRLAPSASAPPAAPDLSSDAAILQTLQNDPSYDTVVEVLQRLSSSSDIKTANTAANRILRTLLETTLPTFTDALEKKQRRQLAECFASAVGLSAAVGRIKTLLPAVRDKAAEVSTVERKQLGDVLGLVQTVLGRRNFVGGVWGGIRQEAEPKRGLLWKEFVGLVGGGKLLGIAAEAEVALGRNFDQEAEGGMRWIGDGPKYAVWLGKELAEAAAAEELDDEIAKAMSQLLAGSFRLGYTDQILETFTFRLLHLNSSLPALLRIIPLLPDHDKRTFTTALLRVLATAKLNTPPTFSDKTWWKHDASVVSGASALLESIVTADDSFREILLDWLTSSSGGGVGQQIGIRRAVVLVVAKSPMSFRSLFEKSMQQFADKLWIKHTPVLRQEVNVQVLLLCAGWAERNSPKTFERVKKSSDFLNGVSNRLGALSSQRARFLGMIVAEAFSHLGDDTDIKLNFDVEETQTDEALWWKSIPSVEDSIGNVEDLFTTPVTTLSLAPAPAPSAPPTTSSAPTAPDTDDSDDDFQPYAMPANAPPPDSDSDEPPNRNKPSPPVYLRDLLTYLQKPDSYDHISLALQHAAALIRRKTTSPPSKDLATHLLPLLTTLTHLHDSFSLPSFTAHKRAACTALVLAAPSLAAPALAAEIFTPHLGLPAKLELLTILSLAARELGGIDTPAAADTTAAAPIPNRYYAATTARLADEIHSSVIAPGLPREVSTRRFFSARKPPAQERLLHRYAGPAFVYPLTARFWLAARDGTARVFGLGEKTLLEAVVHALAVVVHAAGPACPGLVDMVREVWGLMAAVRGSAVEAVLGGLCVLLETMMAGGVEGRRRVAEEFGRELVETQEWVGAYFDGAEEGRGRVLAAGVLVRIGEVMEEWRSLVLGGVGIEY